MSERITFRYARGINDDPGDAGRTHARIYASRRYGLEGQIERGVTYLMQEAKQSNMNTSPHVQAVSIFSAVAAALRATGNDPEAAWSGAMAHRRSGGGA